MRRLGKRSGGAYDLVAANIVADVIVRLVPYARTITKKDGWFLCSGILVPRLAEVEDALRGAGFAIEETMCREDWAAVLARA